MTVKKYRQSSHVQARASFSCSPDEARMMANVMNAASLGRDARSVVSTDPALFARIAQRVSKARATAERLEAYRKHVDAMKARHAGAAE